MRRRKAYCTGKEGYASSQANWKRKSVFYKKKKEELQAGPAEQFSKARGPIHLFWIVVGGWEGGGGGGSGVVDF